MSIVDNKKFSGFSIIELVVVVLLLGVLSVFALGAIFNEDKIAARGFFDDTVAAVRFAQKFALSSGCDVQVSLSAGGYVLNQRATSCVAGAFSRAVPNPANRANPYQNTQVAGLTVPDVNITFNARGLPAAAGNTTVTMTAPGVSYSFRVYKETGLVDVL